jgi:hypothetical protein
MATPSMWDRCQCLGIQGNDTDGPWYCLNCKENVTVRRKRIAPDIIQHSCSKIICLDDVPVGESTRISDFVRTVNEDVNEDVNEEMNDEEEASGENEEDASYAMPDIVEESSLAEEDPVDMTEQSVVFTITNNSTERGKRTFTDSRGFAYTIAKEGKRSRLWRCVIRKIMFIVNPQCLRRMVFLQKENTHISILH